MSLATSKPVLLLQKVFSFGKGRPVAAVILLWLTLMNLGTELPVGMPAPSATVSAIVDFFGAPFRSGRQMLFDSYQRKMPRVQESQPVAIVAIDEASLAQVGQWPWPRNRLAELIDRIAAHQPAAIGLDLYMPEPDQTSPGRVAGNLPADAAAELRQGLARLPSHEQVLAAALRNAPTVLGAAGFDFEAFSTSSGLRSAPLAVSGGDALPFVRKFPRVLASLPELQAAAQGQAVLSVDLEAGVVRRVPLVMAVGEQLVPGLAMEMLRVASGSSAVELAVGHHGVSALQVADLAVPTQPAGEIWLHFASLQTGAERYVSAIDVLEGRANPEQLAGKLVLVGLTGAGLNDMRTTALGELVPGIEIQAQTMETMFDGRFLLRPWWMKWVETAGLLALGFLMIWFVPQTDSTLAAVLKSLPRASMWLTLLLNLIILGIGYFLFVQRGLLFDGTSFFIVLSSVMGSLISSAMLEIDRQAKALAAMEQRLREEQAMLTGSRSTAWRIQFGAMADMDALFAGEQRFSIAAMLEPAQDGGSDFCELLMLDQRRLLFVLGRVGATGIPASRFIVVVKTLLKQAARRIYYPEGIVALFDKEIAADNPGQISVSFLLGIYDAADGRITIKTKDAPLPWHLTASGRIVPLTDAATGFQLEPGDLLLAAAAGVANATNTEGVSFGARLPQAALSAGELRPALVLETVRRAVEDHLGAPSKTEDMTLIALRREKLAS